MSGRVLVTGGLGFIGTNLVHRLLGCGRDVVVLDDVSQEGVRQNLDWLSRLHGSRFVIRLGDVRDPSAVHAAMQGATSVFHLAAQGAVAPSLASPAHDFDVNARGTLNVLEASRARQDKPFVLFTSTSEVYGPLHSVPLLRAVRRWHPEDPAVARSGISEGWPLDLQSPFACSKGAADQYVLDYARSFGVPAVVLRPGCVYGPHERGDEDSDGVGHFCASSLAGRTVAIHGDGRQVRDLLFVDDLVDAMLLIEGSSSLVAGHAFNVGGGPANALSLLELCDELQRLTLRSLGASFEPWRSGDRRWYVSDVTKLTAAVGWRPRTSVTDGLARLVRWMAEGRAARSPSAAARC